MWWHHYNPWGWGAGSVIFMFILWIIIIICIVALVRWAVYGGGYRRHMRDGWWYDKDKGEDSALTILKERYAKGEISKEEFEARKKDLMS